MQEEDMKGTITYYLPLNRDAQTPPQATVVVRRRGQNDFQAGLAVCAPNDQFIKRVGRRMAFHRLCGRPLLAETALDLVVKIQACLSAVGNLHPRNDTKRVQDEVLKLQGPISHMRAE